MKNPRCWTALIILPFLGSQLMPLNAGADEATDKASCKSACDEYHAAAVKGTSKGDQTTNEQMSYAYVKKECGTIPASENPITTGSGAGRVKAESQGVDPKLKSGDQEWDACFFALQTRWGILGQHCGAMAITQGGHDQELASAIAYTVATTTCTIACIAEKTGVGSASKGVCIGAGIAAAAVDIGAMLYISGLGKGERGGGSGVLDMASLLGAGASATMTSRIDSCAGIIPLGAAAALKFVNMGIMSGNSMNECRSVLEHKSASVDLNPDTSGDKPKVGVLRQEIAGDTSLQTGKGGSTGGAGITSYSASIPEQINDFPNGKFAAALSGPFGTLFGAIENKDKMPAYLQQATGLTLKDIGKRLESGQSPGQIISGISGLGDVGTQIAKIDQGIRDGKINLKGMEAIATTSGGGGKGVAKPATASPFGMFGMKSPGIGGGAGGEQTFEKTKKEIAPSPEGDIWHEGYGGSIFQIVSGKLVKERERVDALEWDTPLNRALAGLPSKKTK